MDAQGDRLTPQALNDMAHSSRFPLMSRHDVTKPTLGYIDNLRVEPMPEASGEWALMGDVFVEAGTLDEAMKGWSLGMTAEFVSGRSDAAFGFYLPYPLYQDDDLIERLSKERPSDIVGAHLQKGAVPEYVGIVVAFGLFVLGPEWARIYESSVRPALARALSSLRRVGASGPFSFRFPVSVGPVEFEMLIVPERGSIDSDKLWTAFAAARAWAEEDDDARVRGLKTLVVCLDSPGGVYRVVTAVYIDGSARHAA